MLCVEAMQRQPWGPPSRAIVNLVMGTGAGAPGYRPRDVWNLVAAWKHGFDGLTDAGIWPDDSHEWAGLGSVRIDPSLAPGVYVTLERVFIPVA